MICFQAEFNTFLFFFLFFFFLLFFIIEFSFSLQLPALLLRLFLTVYFVRASTRKQQCFILVKASDTVDRLRMKAHVHTVILLQTT